MEFPFQLPPQLRESEDPIVTITAESLRPPRSHSGLSRNWQDMNTIIDEMGAASSKAQKLPQIITSAERLLNSNHRLYLLRDLRAPGCNVLGLIKVGEKKLFLHDEMSRMHEKTPLCVLDFYVHESCQRTGLGKLLFDYMTVVESVEPSELAIDRPSHKFLSFLGRHFGLNAPLEQANNFVVYRSFFSNKVTTSSRLEASNMPACNSQNSAVTTHDDSSQGRIRKPPMASSMNPPSRYARGANQMKTSSGLSAAMGYMPAAR